MVARRACFVRPSVRPRERHRSPISELWRPAPTLRRQTKLNDDDVTQQGWGTRAVLGVDFSGARDAGKYIWIAAVAKSAGRLEVFQCDPVRELVGTPDLGPGLDYLVGRLEADRNLIVGFDFPFSLPKALVPRGDWFGMVGGFSEAFASAEAFRTKCWEAAGHREVRRVTDDEAHTPWSPYNERLYRQTYYGIRDVLAPLVARHAVSVLPLMEPDSACAWAVEVCPASTKRRLGLSGPPLAILDGLRAAGLVCSPLVRNRVLGNARGDALDSVVAAYAVATASPLSLSTVEPYNFEGQVVF